jgi:hypothetical protein
MRQWRDQARTGKRPAVGGRDSGANWRTGRQPDQWDDGDEYGQYDEGPPSGRMSARQARPAQNYQDYEEVDLERALVPNYGDLMPMSQSMRSVAIPGMPATDDEERALGIRRPVYIPASGERGKRKLGTWRVVSGVASIMLVCIASCGLAGIIGRDHLGFLSGPAIGVQATASYPTFSVPKTPQPTQGPQAKYVQNVTTATAVDSNYVPINTTSHFLVNADVYVVASVRNLTAGKSHTLSIHWFLDRQDLQLTASSALTKTITKDSNVYFSLRYPTAGLGSAKLYFDRPSSDPDADTAYLAAAIDFAVQMPSTPTAKPGSPTPKTGSPTPGGSVTPGSKTPSPSPSPKASTGTAPIAWRSDGPA